MRRRTNDCPLEDNRKIDDRELGESVEDSLAVRWLRVTQLTRSIVLILAEEFSKILYDRKLMN